MQRFWEKVIEPFFEILQPKVIVEIGSAKGGNTENLLGYCRRSGATLHVIDPAPKYEDSDWQQRHGQLFVFHRDLSLNALPLIEGYDAVLIDGDHNWYTVLNELRLIEETCQERSQDFPLVLLHDIGWPYGRRDLYYNPDTIPQEYQNPFEKKGMVPGTPELVEEGGMNPNANNAIWENKQSNGVLTAVEDFLYETQRELELLKLPGMHGLGILFTKQLKEGNHKLAQFLEELKFSPFVERYVEAVEENRLDLEIRRREAQKKLKGKRQELRGKRQELKAARHDVERLTTWMETLDKEISALLKSRQLRIGSTVEEIYRKATLKADEPTAPEHLREILGQFHTWRKDQERSEESLEDAGENQ